MQDIAESSRSAFDVPDHVPQALVRDFDYIDMGEEKDVWAFWGKLLDGPDIFFTPRNGGHWVLTRHDDIAAVFENFSDFSSRHETVPKGSIPIPIPPIEMDPPLHADFRRLIAPFFTPKSISDLEARARALTIELIERFQDRGQCEFVAEFAFQMPIGIFMSLADLPEEDRLYLLGLAEIVVRPVTVAQRQETFEELFAYLRRKLLERMENPGDDMLSAIVKGRIDGGRPLTMDEMQGMAANLIAAGLDTVAGMMGFIMLFLARNPDHRRRLAEHPETIPVAVEELMRRHGIANIARMATRDLEFNGVRMRAGDMVMTATSIAGLDDRRYDDPLRVDFDRADKKSLVFGRGPHSCIGAFLARTELRVLLSEWLKRIPDFAIAPGETPVGASGSSSVVRYLPLVWDVPRG